MKINAICVCLFFSIVQNLAFGQVKDVKMPVHPRILLLQDEEKAILKNIASDQNWAKLNKVIIDESNKIIPLPTLERIQIGRRLLDKSRECLRRVFFLSYAYRITKDKKYLNRAEKELIKVSQFSDWNPSHFLDVAEMTMGVAIGYDWLYDDLAVSSKEIIKEAILKKGIEPSYDTKYNSWLKASHNWNQVCNAGMAYGALAIYEDNQTLAKQVIDRAIESIKLPMEDYKPEGSYPEGYGYWGYGTSFNVMFLSAIQKVFSTDFGLSETAGFLKTAGYFQNMIGSSGKNFNYSDSGGGSGLSPSMFWFANKTQNNSLLFIEKQYLQGKDKSMGRDRLLPATMIWGKDINLEKVSEPKQMIWVGQGKNPVAMMRSSWSKPDAIYIGLKGGSPSVNHGHMDVGSFVMDANGERWSMDLGMQEYETLESKGVKLWGMTQNSERWQVYRYNNLAHSTLAFDNEFQKVEGYAPITSFTEKPNFLSATSNISAVYKGNVASANRGVAIIDQKYVAIKDEIVTSEKETTVRWAMMTPAEVKINENGTAELTQNGKKLQIKVVEPANITLKTWTTQPSHDYDAPNPGTILVGFEVKIPANSSVSLGVLLIPEGAIVKQKLLPLKDWKK
ncbi:heparinase II/III family protein [Emticicia sp.]|uniref:heparinase II/III domain-containing protein n=1 Tax=Emticicia sp. TaxID=1930953 RepID=UPI003751DD00